MGTLNLPSLYTYYDDITFQTKNRSAVKMRNHSNVTDLQLSTNPPPPHPEGGGEGEGDLPPHKSKNLFNLTLNFRCLPAANRLFEKLQAVTKPNP